MVKINNLSHIIEEVLYSNKNPDGVDGNYIVIKLFNRRERIPLFLTEEQYNSEIIKTRIAEIITKPFLKWDGTAKGIEELIPRLEGYFLSYREFEVLKKYKKGASGKTNRKRIREIYDLD